ncbi:hypothetical protein BASA83_005342 [Batrachochytrium salamandrivorans]|nr:hypothetical protein BASA83_005342 [Batrachochytrium salamandrivorans]
MSNIPTGYGPFPSKLKFKPFVMLHLDHVTYLEKLSLLGQLPPVPSNEFGVLLHPFRFRQEVPKYFEEVSRQLEDEDECRTKERKERIQ